MQLGKKNITLISYRINKKDLFIPPANHFPLFLNKYNEWLQKFYVREDFGIFATVTKLSQMFEYYIYMMYNE